MSQRGSDEPGTLWASNDPGTQQVAREPADEAGIPWAINEPGANKEPGNWQGA